MLDDQAHSWYTHIDTPFRDFEDFKIRFVDRFTGVTSEQWKTDMLTEMRRGETQDQFISKFEAMTKRYGLDNGQKLLIFKLMVLPEYRPSLMTTEISSFEKAVQKLRTLAPHNDLIKHSKPDCVKDLEKRLDQAERSKAKHKDGGSSAGDGFHHNQFKGPEKGSNTV